jgi:hypothetical protein
MIENKIIKHICIGHKAMDYSPNVDYMYLTPISLGIHNEFVIEDTRFGENVNGQSLSEYSQLFGLMDMIKSGEVNADYLHLFQYRKFLSPTNGGYNSIASWVKILTPDMATKFFPKEEDFQIENTNLITGGIFNFGESNVSMYNKTHVLEDFLMFVACCKDNKISNEDIRFFSMMHGIIPSPTLTFISVELFIKHMEILKRIGLDYLNNYHVNRIGYQSRSIGYLLERLHSKIIYDELSHGNLINIPVWNRFVINSNI